MGFGTWAWGNQVLWGYQESMDTELQDAFNLALKNGITLFDTADSYGTGRLNGQSEKLLGKFISDFRGTANIKCHCYHSSLGLYSLKLGFLMCNFFFLAFCLRIEKCQRKCCHCHKVCGLPMAPDSWTVCERMQVTPPFITCNVAHNYYLCTL